MFAYLKSLFKKRPLLGLDLGLNEIRLLQLQRREPGFHIEKILAIPLHFPGRGMERPYSFKELESELGDILTQHSLRDYSAALALPSQSVLKKIIELPAYFKEQELSQELGRRIGEHFPDLPEKEIQFDYRVQHSDEDKQQVLIVAARAEQLQAQVGALAEAGLDLRIIDTDLYAIARAAQQVLFSSSSGLYETAVLLDLRWPFNSLIVLQAQKLIFHHQWHLTQEILQSFQEDYTVLVQQVKTVWQLCKATHPKLRMEALALSGELAPLGPFAIQLQAQLSVPVKLLNPFQGMTHSPFIAAEKLDVLASRFLQCCGLAMRSEFS